MFKAIILLLCVLTFAVDTYSSGGERIKAKFFTAIRLNSINDLKKALKDGASINYKTRSGLSPLTYAVTCGNRDIISYLVDTLKIDINAQDSLGLNALHRAVNGKRYIIIKQLLESGADPNVCSKEGKTPLDFAASTGNIKTILILLDAKYKTKIILDQSKLSSIYYAAAKGCFNTIDLLCVYFYLSSPEYIKENQTKLLNDTIAGLKTYYEENENKKCLKDPVLKILSKSLPTAFDKLEFSSLLKFNSCDDENQESSSLTE